jgi:large subunit ribosomal protein L3
MTTADSGDQPGLRGRNGLGLLGRKVGMMRIFTDDGDAVPVTVVDVSNNRVSQVKTVETDGYSALQVVFGSRKASRITKPVAGHLAKAGVEAGEIIQEFRVPAEVAGQYAPGAAVPVATLFAVGQLVDVQGTSIGKGFTGTIKRHHFSSQRASHGNSRSHNVPGSISMAQDPGRVFPGKRMSGHLGDDTVTTQNLDVVRVDEEGCPPRYYFPRPDVRMDLLERTPSMTRCPFKGAASYFTLDLFGKKLTDACWSYEEPCDEHAGLRGRIAFYLEKFPELELRMHATGQTRSG